MKIVVGVGDVKQAGSATSVRVEMYAPHAQTQVSSTMSLVVRTKSDPTALTAELNPVNTGGIEALKKLRENK